MPFDLELTQKPAFTVQLTLDDESTCTWMGAQLVSLTDVNSALSSLSKGYRKPPVTSNLLPKMPKLLKERQKHQAETLKESEEDFEEVTGVTKKPGLLGSPHNNKISKGLAKFLREQIGLEITGISYQFSIIILIIDLISPKSHI